MCGAERSAEAREAPLPWMVEAGAGSGFGVETAAEAAVGAGAGCGRACSRPCPARFALLAANLAEREQDVDGSEQQKAFDVSEGG
ncbi:hypothetical protein HGI30_16900 [Paenibacillus albicereus]|uniref:Uncharacterized protein n=1 Tax=Paenibacillus albicereus TaxID=2726185 RepID=A0A6H2H0B1_9BACL|nr:hypothetical protein [Paenibacillus albicereus]QJC53087.1 hypothetical protein HGI30_16900 [Paenibacillus albicereus]